MRSGARFLMTALTNPIFNPYFIFTYQTMHGHGTHGHGTFYRLGPGHDVAELSFLCVLVSAGHELFLLINVEMPTSVRILAFFCEMNATYKTFWSKKCP